MSLFPDSPAETHAGSRVDCTEAAYHQNKNFILTHGVSGVDWRFYKHPLPEHVYNVYMKYWREVELSR